MSPPNTDELIAQLEETQDIEANLLAEKAEKFVALKELSARVDAKRKAAYRDLMEAMEEQGLKGVRTETHNVGMTVASGWRIREGQSVEEHQANMQLARDWVERYNAQQTSITQTTLAKTFDAFVESEGGDVAPPAFLEPTEVSRLSVRKAKQ